MSKILIIEDEKAMSDLIAIKFKVEGMEVDQAFSLAEAKQKLSQPQSYDAILSDYLLPDGNALDLLTEMKQLPQVTKVPVIMATNYIEDLSQDKAKALGIAEVIVKYQVVPAQMVQKIKALLGNNPAAAPVAPAAVQTSASTTPVVPAPAVPVVPNIQPVPAPEPLPQTPAPAPVVEAPVATPLPQTPQAPVENPPVDEVHNPWATPPVPDQNNPS